MTPEKNKEMKLCIYCETEMIPKDAAWCRYCAEAAERPDAN